MRFAPALRFLRRPAAPVRRPQDPADMGTAFGMEACLEPDLAAAPPAYSLESQRPHPPRDNPMAWLRERRRSN
ncbi:MAG: hypothetical protein ACK520_00330 [Inhella sp.]